MSIFTIIINTGNFLPHGFCIKWTPSLLWLYVVSDALIVLAYYSIPIVLAYFVWRRKDLQFRMVFILFGAFILACGTTHLLGIVLLWKPLYWLDAGMKAVTAIISVITAFTLVWLLPKALKLPSPAQLDKEVGERLQAYEALKAAQASLVDMTRLKEAEEARNQIAFSLQATFEAIPDLLFELGLDGHCYMAHTPDHHLMIEPVEKLVGSNFKDILPPEPAAILISALIEANEKGRSQGRQLQLDVPVGNRWFELSVSRKSMGGDLSGRFIVLARDVTERKLAEENLRVAATAFESQDGMFVTDANKVILRVNRAFTTITGYSAEEAVGKTPALLKSGRQDQHFYASMWDSINHTGAWEGEIWNLRKNGELYPERLVITSVKNADGAVSNYVASLTDITATKAATDEIKNLAFFDPLTRLPNRRLLIDRLKQALASSARSGNKGALLFLDLDHFKTLNDTLGHDVGDLLLQQVAARLTSCVREGDTVARIGGDEFVVLLEDLSPQPIEAAALAENISNKILESVDQLYQLAAHSYRSTVSIGATLLNDHVTGVEELLKQADIAMYQAKDSGRNALRFFDPQMQEAITARTELEDQLRMAIEQQQFKLYYQVQVDNDGLPIGAEALIRWLHPERGLVPPLQFIPLAEDTGMILPIGSWVLDTACAQLKKWQQNKATRELSLSVNVSAKQFHQPEFVNQVQSILERHAIDPAFLKLELTESTLLEDVEGVIHRMMKLRKIGVRFELDDFGTGYSSLQYLKKLPLNQLKIDQSFVFDITLDSSDRALVRTIIAMAHSLDLKVIAEGVETPEQLDFLKNKGCNHYQGYLFGKPMPIEELEASFKLL